MFAICASGIYLVLITLFCCKIYPRIKIKNFHGPYTRDEINVFLFAEDAFVLFYYLTALAYLFYYLIDLDFFWHGDIHNNRGSNYDDFAKASEPFIIMNAFFYFGLLCTLFVRPVRRSNWVELLAHHIVTLSFIYVGYVTVWRAASVWILGFNIMCDIFVQLSQIAHRAESKLDIPLFAALICVHTYTRLYMFPIRAIETYNTSQEEFVTPLDHLTYIIPFPLVGLWAMWLIRMLIICYQRLVLKQARNDYADVKVD